MDFTNQLENGEIFPSFKNIKIDINKIFTNIKSYPIINSSSLLKNNNIIKAKKIIELKSIEQENFNKNIENFIFNINSLIKNNEKAIIFASDKKSLESIKEIFNENNIDNFSIGLDSNLNNTNIILTENSLSRGLFSLTKK